MTFHGLHINGNIAQNVLNCEKMTEVVKIPMANSRFSSSVLKLVWFAIRLNYTLLLVKYHGKSLTDDGNLEFPAGAFNRGRNECPPCLGCKCPCSKFLDFRHLSGIFHGILPAEVYSYAWSRATLASRQMTKIWDLPWRSYLLLSFFHNLIHFVQYSH